MRRDRQFTGWCLDRHDLCVAKLCAFRTKDRNFVGALLGAGLVEALVIEERLDAIAVNHEQLATRARSWVRARS